MKQTYEKPLAMGNMTKEEFDAALQRGFDDIAAGRVIPAEVVEEEMRRFIAENSNQSDC